MELKTRFNIGDKVYYINKSRNSGIIVDKYEIDDLDVCKGLNDDIYIQYNIHNPKMAQDRHSVYENDIYPLNNIDKVLENIKNELEKGEK